MNKFILILSILFCNLLNSQILIEESFTDCIDIKKFDFSDFTMMPDTHTTRKLGSQDESPVITVEESFRIRYNYKGFKFMDVKIEYPHEGAYLEDKETLATFFNYLGEVGEKDNKLSHFEDLMGYEAYILDRYKPLSKYHTLSTNIVFDDKNERFIYLYYWNVNREKEIFPTINEFLEIKAESFEQMMNCINK